jgi:hypothetical protein
MNPSCGHNVSGKPDTLASDRNDSEFARGGGSTDRKRSTNSRFDASESRSAHIHFRLQKVPDQLAAMLGQEGFGVEQQTFRRSSGEATAHDYSIRRFCGHLELGRNGCRVDLQGMVARRAERAGN